MSDKKDHLKDHPKDHPKDHQENRPKENEDEEDDKEDHEEEDEDDSEEGFIDVPTGVIIPPKDLEFTYTLPSHCQLASGECLGAVEWAQQHIKEGWPSVCSEFNEIQEKFSWQTGTARHECSVPCQAAPLPASLPQCHIPVAREWCYEVVQWAMLRGINSHPEWYPGLHPGSSFDDFQRLFWKGGWGTSRKGPPRYANCGEPCKVPQPDAERPMRATPNGVCMYELPTKFNLELRDSAFRQREPKARPLKLRGTHLQGLHDQNQFAVERVFYDRMQAGANTLRWPADCKAFYVPYFTQWETGDIKGVWKVADRPWLENELLGHLVHYGQHRRRRCHGPTLFNDHFLVLGRVSRDGAHFLNNGRFANMVKLSIEDTNPGRWSNVYAIPYPSWFRYGSALDTHGSRTYVEVMDMNCKSLRDIGFWACRRKEVCTLDTRWADCPGTVMLWAKYRCGTAVRQIVANIKDPLRNRVVLSCRTGPCWLSGSCADQACRYDFAISGKGTKLAEWQAFWPQGAANGAFHIKTHHGMYVMATPDGSVRGGDGGTGWWETFWQEPQGNGEIAIRTWHGTHLSVNQAGDVSAIRGEHPGGWEKFRVQKTAQGALAFRTYHGKYLTAEKSCMEVWGGMTSPAVVILGSAKPFEVVRKRIIEHCQARSKDCVYVGTGARGKSSGDLKDKIGRFAEILTTSLFCINPPGDTPTRKGIFDSLLLGCIPVITDSKSLEYYRWHLPEWWSVSVYVSEDIMDKTFNIVDYLMHLKETDRGGMVWRMMQIEKLAFSLQYSMEPTSKANRGSDAFDVALQKVVELAQRR